jgi:hypothetical protein
VQISKVKSFVDLKKRVADCLSFIHGTHVTEQQVRMWKVTFKDAVIAACEKITGRTEEEKKEADNRMATDSDFELNSGVPFPGESLEPMLGMGSNLDDDTFEDAGLVIEYNLNPSLQPSFAFSF